MGLGSTARRVQQLTDTAEELYGKISEVLDRVREIESSIEETNERVTEIEARLDRQERLLEALADDRGVNAEPTRSDESGRAATGAASDEAPGESPDTKP